MSVILSYSLKNNSDKTYTLALNNPSNEFYLVEQYFHRDHICDYLKETVVTVDVLNNGSLIVSPIIEFNIYNNILVVAEEEYEIRNVNNKLYKFIDNDYGPELQLLEVKLDQLYSNDVKRTYVEESYYIEYEGKNIMNEGRKYDGPCHF